VCQCRRGRAGLRRRADRVAGRTDAGRRPRCDDGAPESRTGRTGADRRGMTSTQGYRVGVDVGGTFTDLICVTPDGTVLMDKTPTTPEDQSIGVMDGLARLAERAGL